MPSTTKYLPAPSAGWAAPSTSSSLSPQSPPARLHSKWTAPGPRKRVPFSSLDDPPEARGLQAGLLDTIAVWGWRVCHHRLAELPGPLRRSGGPVGGVGCRAAAAGQAERAPGGGEQGPVSHHPGGKPKKLVTAGDLSRLKGARALVRSSSTGSSLFESLLPECCLECVFECFL
jgi:hypothetical protein